LKTVTFIGVNYYPEDTAIALYTTQLAEFLANNGFEVNMITGFPYYPSWEINESYQKKDTFLKEKINKITIYRYKQYVPKDPTFFKRILHLIDFTLGSCVNIFKIKNTDLVVCIVPFTSTIIPSKLLARFRKAKLWVHIQDFEFEAALETNLTNKRNIFITALFKVEKILLNRADALSTISKSMLTKLKQKNKKNIPTYLLPNWVDIDIINPFNTIRHQYLDSDKFKILYAGNIGEKQDWQFLLDLARRLNNNTKVEFILVGDGAKKNWLLNELKSYTNVSYFKTVPYKELSNLLCSADLHVLFQKDNITDTVMPSKILAMMASQKPSIITGNLQSEVATMINKSKGGFYFKSNDLDGVIASINNLCQHQKETKKMGINARKFVTEKFSSQKILWQFKLYLDQIIEK
jgi:colanic acid biosynthesis glycosyl transferase WcaI